MQYSQVGLFGKGVAGLLLLGPVEGDVVLGTVGVDLGPGLRAVVDAGLEGEVRFSGVLASVTGWKWESRSKSYRSVMAPHGFVSMPRK